jgi:chromatin structure-remodeling complex subunit RSC9
MCFETDPSSEMTQIHLWQSYQATFLRYQASHPTLIAGDFIKNVSHTFSGASAQVAHANKYVIRGIRPRKVAQDIHAKELFKCCWRTNPAQVAQEIIAIFANDDGNECGEFFLNPEKLWEHMIASHLKVPKKPSTVDLIGDNPHPVQNTATSSKVAFDFASADPSITYRCQWGTCSRQLSTEHSLTVGLALLARHVNTHLPDKADLELRRQHQLDAKTAEDPNAATRVWYRTMADEHNDAAGLPLGSALVLRNIARGVRKMAPTGTVAAPSSETTAVVEDKALNSTASAAPADGDGDDDTAAVSMPEAPVPASAETMQKIFDPIRERLFYAMAHNPTLSHYIAAIIRAIAAGGG